MGGEGTLFAGVLDPASNSHLRRGTLAAICRTVSLIGDGGEAGIEDNFAIYEPLKKGFITHTGVAGTFLPNYTLEKM